MPADRGPYIDPSAQYTSVERFEPGQSNAAVTRLASVAALGGFLFGCH